MADQPESNASEPFPSVITSGGVTMTRTPDEIYVSFPDITPQSEIRAFRQRHGLEAVISREGLNADSDITDMPRRLWLRSTGHNDLTSLIERIRQDGEFEDVSPVYHRADLLPMQTGHALGKNFLVRFVSGASKDDVRAVIEARSTTEVAVYPDEIHGDLYHLALNDRGSDILATLAGFDDASIVRETSLNWIQLQSPASTTWPNDPYFGEQWNLERIGLPAGWAETKGTADIVIAIVDSGCDLTHPDLVNKYVPPADRFDAINNEEPMDLGDHGTLVAGVAAAETHNTIGIAGVAPLCRIMPVRLMDLRPGFTALQQHQIVAAIEHARTHGADVINMSWYATADHDQADRAIDRARDAGLVLVAASGNYPAKLSSTPVAQVLWPATHPGVIAVGATDWDDRRKEQQASTEKDPWASRYGDELSVMAPSPIPWTTRDGGRYSGFIGTSAAAPQVAGLAALLLSIFEPWIPSFWTSEVVRPIIEATASKVGGYPYAKDSAHPRSTWHQEMGYGRIHVAAAVKYARNMIWDRFGRPSSAYTEAVTILIGLTGGGPGITLSPGGLPVPVNPGWVALAPAKRDILIGLAITELAERVNDPELRTSLDQAGWAAISRAAERRAGH